LRAADARDLPDDVERLVKLSSLRVRERAGLALIMGQFSFGSVGWVRRGSLGVVGRGLGDVSERCGSVDRHNDVRELGSQFWDAQEGAPE
jgi:hypothetical protein